MDQPTFKDYLMELMVSDDPAQAMQDVKTAARNPDRYKKQTAAKTVGQERDLKSGDDPNKAEKLRIIQMKKQMAQKEKMLAQKEQQATTDMGAERPGTGMM